MSTDDYIRGIINTLLGLGNAAGVTAEEIFDALPTFAPELGVPVFSDFDTALAGGSTNGIFCRRSPVAGGQCPVLTCEHVLAAVDPVYFVNGQMAAQSPGNAQFVQSLCNFYQA